MEAVTDNVDNVNYYVPHHAVVKKTSTTTRVRVVFDASMKTSNGKSLNDILQVGPVVQQDLISIVLRFRTHRYAFTADIMKMYRQIWINPNQWSLQQILWEDDQSRLQVFKLKTVTYGTASAPYLATKCLQRLAQDEEEEFPIASKILKRDFYVDDCLTGSSELHEAIYLQQQLSKLLHKGGFELRKWSSNRPELLNNIAVEHREGIKAIPSKDHIIRTLGLLWQPAKDILLICIETSAQQATTKREVLACIARIFDPIGLLGPVTLRAKTFMQQLWKSKCEWDDPLPIEIQTKWNKFQDQLSHLKSISVKRFVLSEAPYQSLEIHGFADASEQAYGAALYVRCVTTNNEVSVNLLCSKTRLAPLKQISLPRLELCAALLLARLIKNSLASLEVKYTQVYLWTDSMIVLNWIAATPTRWKTFVANRVAEIQEITQSHTWRHIASNGNPADLASRGLNPSELETASLWWMVPQWLHDNKDEWPITKMQIVNNIPEVKSDKVITHVTIQEVHFLNKYSSWGKMKRIVAVMLRFIKNSQSVANKRISGPITLSEIRIAERSILKSIQGIEFKQEIMTIRDRKPLNVKSKLLNLNPFLDQYGLLRVGGRLKYAEITSDRRHPIVLPAKAKVTKLIAFEYHITNLHVGPQGLLCLLREQYWPLAGRSIVLQVVHQCITCFRNKPKSHPPIMGQLPSSRVVPARPFSKVGIDYAGPIPMKQSGSRKSPIVKAYIAVFVCMVTKAIHLELVTSLSSEGFVAALKRFMGRRGKCQDIYCDNGTNFVGAKKQLNDLHQLVLKQTAQEDIKRDMHPDMISWHFIPPHAPHFGGLWEASVKAVKFHLKRVVGNSNLTFEELYTLLVQIEACLNSRPITPMSEDPSDLSALTPAHFLIGDSLQLPIESEQRSTHTNYLKRWQLIQTMFTHFWKRWKNEYLSSLNTRKKWHRDSPSLKIGDLVLIHDDQLPPLQWKLARVCELHPGADEVVRVATVQTAAGVFKRPVVKLYPLPVVED